MSDWTKYKVSDLIASKVLVIGDGYRAKNSELSPNAGLPFARAGNINDGFQFGDAEYLAPENLHKAGDKISRIGDVLFTSKGTVGRIAFVAESTPKFVYSPQLTWWRVLDIHQIDPKFLYCWMRGREFISQINSFSGQTDMAAYVSLKDQRQMMYVTLPRLEKQREIASAVSCLDRKISNLREQNETLEKIAQTLFKHWFVDFEFPFDFAQGKPNTDGKPFDIAQGRPYKSSGGAMVPSELGEIPAGWRVGKLEDICKIINGFAFKSKDYRDDGIKIVRTRNFNNAGFIESNNLVYLSEDQLDKYRNFELQKFDFLMVMVGASIGKSVTVTSHILPALQNQNMWNFRSINQEYQQFLSYSLKLLINQHAKSSTGSAREFFRKDYFYQIPIILPEKEVISAFSSACNTGAFKIDLNIRQIQTLTKIRDALLPKLMSGKLRLGGD